MKLVRIGEPKAQLVRLKRIGGLRFLYNRLLYYRGRFFDEEVEGIPQEFIDNLPEVLKTLNAREQLVLQLRYLEEQPKSLAQVGKIMGVSKERIRQIETKSLRKMMGSLNMRSLGINRKKRSRYFT